MKSMMNIARKAMAVAAFLTLSVAADAAEVVYKIVEYNKQTAEFKIAACGMVPRNSRVYPKSVIRISLCRTAKRNPLIFPI